MNSGVTLNCGHFQWASLHNFFLYNTSVFNKNFVYITRANAHQISQAKAGFYKSLAFFKKTSQNLHIRTFTITASAFKAQSDFTNSSIVPVKTYRNVDINKLLILKENKGKAGVYR